MDRYEIAHQEGHGRINGMRLTSEAEQWDVVDTNTGEVVAEIRTLYGRSGLERAEEWAAEMNGDSIKEES